MHLIVDNQTDLERLINRARLTPYAYFPDNAKAELMHLLDLDHQIREQIRFAGVAPGFTKVEATQ